MWTEHELGITNGIGGGAAGRKVHVGVPPHPWPMTIPETLTRAELGALGEQLAVEHLTALGLQILARNWRCRYGELDVIAADPAARTVIFVEVKTRTGDGFGGLAEAVTPAKVRRLRRLAALWLAAQDAAGRRSASTSSGCGSGGAARRRSAI